MSGSTIDNTQEHPPSESTNPPNEQIKYSSDASSLPTPPVDSQTSIQKQAPEPPIEVALESESVAAPPAESLPTEAPSHNNSASQLTHSPPSSEQVNDNQSNDANNVQHNHNNEHQPPQNAEPSPVANGKPAESTEPVSTSITSAITASLPENDPTATVPLETLADTTLNSNDAQSTIPTPVSAAQTGPSVSQSNEPASLADSVVSSTQPADHPVEGGVKREGEMNLEPPSKRIRTESGQVEISNTLSESPLSLSQTQPNVEANGSSNSVPLAAKSLDESAQLPQALPKQQQRYAVQIMRNLKKSKDAPPFLKPVDPAALGIPTYHNVITTPMDFGTVEAKLNQSQSYRLIEEFANDVRLVFRNCYTFNGAESPISQMAGRLEAAFERQYAKMPPAIQPKAEVPEVLVRKPSINEGRPKRDIHRPLPFEPAQDENRPRRRKSTNRIQSEQLRFCSQVLRDLTKKSNEGFTYPFLMPVDPIALGIPDYFQIVKKPMDLSTMRKKLDNEEYDGYADFEADFKLIIKNCKVYNPAGTTVHNCGVQLDQAFNEKWRVKPDESALEMDFSENEGGNAAIAAMERKVTELTENIERLKRQQKRTSSSGGLKSSKGARNSPPTKSSGGGKARRPSNAGGSKSSRKAVDSDEDYDGLRGRQVTDAMKQELARAMETNADEDKLHRVIEIIRSSQPELISGQNEIELEIDLLSNSTISRLHDFMIGRRTTKKAPGTKKPGRAGTGGVNRTTIDESAESAKIQQLQAQLNQFTNPGVATGTAAAVNTGMSGVSPSTGRPATGHYASSDSDGSSESDSEDSD